MKIEVRGEPSFDKKFRRISKSDPVWHKTQKLISLLYENKDAGDEVKKSRFPKKYKGQLSTLFRYRLNGDRILYTIVIKNNIKKFMLLELLCHNEYNKLFGYPLN